MLFDEAEKEFDIDSFLAPYFPNEPLLMKTDEDTVFGSPLSSPKRPDNQHQPLSLPPPLEIPPVVPNTLFSKQVSEATKGTKTSPLSKSGDERRLAAEHEKRPRPARARRPKKRRRTALKKGAEDANEVSELDLLHLSLTEYEELVTSITSGRDLSPNEKQQFTRQRRLIKNRESAQASRQRKKSYIEDLERKVNELVNENAQLKQTVTTLTSEKNRLEVLFVQQAMTGEKKEGVDLSTDVFQVLNNKNGVNLKSNNNKATMIVLLIVLFSFGLLFHQVATQKSFSVVNTDRNIEPVVSKKTQKLDQFLVPGPVKVVDVHPQLEEVMPSRHLKKTTKRVMKHETSLPSRGTKRMKDDQPLQPIKNQKSTNPPAPKSTRKDLSEVSKIIRPEIANWKPNTTYLLCTNVSQIIPPPSASIEDPDAPLMVSFLIPPDSLNGSQATSSTSDNLGDESVLEVTCQVVDVSNIPLNNRTCF